MVLWVVLLCSDVVGYPEDHVSLEFLNNLLWKQKILEYWMLHQPQEFTIIPCIQGVDGEKKQNNSFH